jgi:HSP20 family molecular chaperone IbpA
MSSERIPIAVEHVASLCAEVQEVYSRIAAKAYEYFLEGGCINGHDVDDWLRAEHELLFKPTVRLRREPSDFVVEVDLPGVEPADLQIRVTLQRMLLISVPFEPRQIFRMVRFPEAIDTAGVQTGFYDGTLKVIAPIAAETIRSLGTVA